ALVATVDQSVEALISRRDLSGNELLRFLGQNFTISAALQVLRGTSAALKRFSKAPRVDGKLEAQLQDLEARQLKAIDAFDAAEAAGDVKAMTAAQETTASLEAEAKALQQKADEALRSRLAEHVAVTPKAASSGYRDVTYKGKVLASLRP